MRPLPGSLRFWGQRVALGSFRAARFLGVALMVAGAEAVDWVRSAPMMWTVMGGRDSRWGARRGVELDMANPPGAQA